MLRTRSDFQALIDFLYIYAIMLSKQQFAVTLKSKKK